ncbi:Unknown protein [Striga hermonthica]|uniref:Uncharacterized protein n=1 Tax=Striga hermonthica TaxID=68872 RepID=A0A9N7RJ88_STRHE|nr:Unknown protein [Striga hermonthica]
MRSASRSDGTRKPSNQRAKGKRTENEDDRAPKTEPSYPTQSTVRPSPTGGKATRCRRGYFGPTAKASKRRSSMVKRRGRPKKQVSDKDKGNQNGVEVQKDEDAFQVERQSAAIRAIRDVEIEQLLTMLRLLKSNFSKEQLQVPVLQFFRENFPNILIDESGEAKWKHELNNADERTLHASLLRRLSMAYPDYSSAGIASMAGGFEFSNKSVKTSMFGADKLQIRSLVFEEPPDSHLKDGGMKTPNVNNNRLSVGVTPKTVRLPKCGEVLLSVHGSPLGVYKEDNMETIQETEDD